MRTGTGIFLLTAGAILLFALRSGSPHWLNLQIVGVILILAGGLGLLLPRLARSRRDGGWLRRWVRPGQPEDLGVPFITQTRAAATCQPGPRRQRPDAGRRPAQLRAAPLSRAWRAARASRARKIPPKRKRSGVGQPATHLVVGYPIRVVNWLMSK